MSYNGSGTFQINSSGQPVVTGTVISSTAFNALTADLATGLSTAITKDGQTTTTSRILFAQGISSTLTTDSTSATTGSIISAGGISTQKALWVGTTATLGIGTTPASITLNGQSGTGAAKGWAILPQVSGVAAGIIGSENYVFGSSDTNLVIQAATSKSIKLFGGAGGDGITISSTGLVGIGTGSPACTLNIYGANTASRGQFSIDSSGTDSRLTWYTSGTFRAALNVTSTDISFDPQNNQNYIFPGTGSLLVGKTSDVNTSTGTALRSTGESRYSVAGAASNTTMAFFRNGSAGESGSITTTSTTTSYVTSSDYRLKENVLPMTGGLATVAALKPVTYDWISNGSAGEGFIAHELQAVIPAAASGEKDAVNEDGSIKPQGVDFGKIVPHLVAAMQEQQATIQELTTRLAALENK